MEAGAERVVVQEIPPDQIQCGRGLRKGLISLALLLALVVGLVLAVPGLKDVGHAITSMSGGWIAAAIGLEIGSCVGYVLVFLRVFDRAPIRFGARVALTELAFGAAVSLGGAGSLAVGAWLLVERGAPRGRVVERSAVLFLFTSAINVITLAVTGLGLWLGLFSGPQNPLLSLLPGAVGLLALIFFLLLPHFIEPRLRGRSGKWPKLLEGTAQSVRDTAQLLRRPDHGWLGAAAYLWCDIAVLYACFLALGSSPPVAVVILAYQIGYLANLIPIPGGIGVLDGSFIGLFVLYGVDATTATAATVVYHAIALWIPAVWGTIAFTILRRSRNQPLTPRRPMTEAERS